MATIELNGSVLNFVNGIDAFGSLSASFSGAKKKAGKLKEALADLSIKIDTAGSAVNVETSQSEAKAAKEREENKESNLTLAYDKLDQLILDVAIVDCEVSERVSDEKDDFYKTYKWLKPECEKGFFEKAGEFFVKMGEGLWDWCKQVFSNVISAITAIVIIAVAIVICIVCAPEIILAIAIVVCAVSALYTIFDVGWMLTHKGQDFATWLENNGHPNWGAFVRGCDFGLTVASFILPAGASIKASMTLGGKTFFQSTKLGKFTNGVSKTFKGKTLLEGSKTVAQNALKGLKTGAGNLLKFCKESGFKGVMKSMGKTAWGGFKSITGIDDILRLKELRNLKNCRPGFLFNFKDELWDLDMDNMCLHPKAGTDSELVIKEANAAYKRAGVDKTIDSIPLTKNAKTQWFIDVDWDKLSIETLGKNEKFSFKNLFKNDGFNFKNLEYNNKDNPLRDQLYADPDSRVNTALNPGISRDSDKYVIYTGKGGEYSSKGFTAHENWNLKQENIVPSVIHNTTSAKYLGLPGGTGTGGKGISYHVGGVSHLNDMRKNIPMFERTDIRNFFIQFSGKAAETAAGGN